jgi:hypothetical protein
MGLLAGNRNSSISHLSESLPPKDCSSREGVGKETSRKRGLSHATPLESHHEYARTKDALYVIQVSGHKNIKNTLIYTQLIQLKDDDYVCKAATTVNQAKSLIEAGFEYICEIEGTRLFRKRK